MTKKDNDKKDNDKKDNGKKLMTKIAVRDHLFNLRRENLHQGLGGKFPH